jgi:hypothetical protein
MRPSIAAKMEYISGAWIRTSHTAIQRAALKRGSFLTYYTVLVSSILRRNEKIKIWVSDLYISLSLLRDVLHDSLIAIWFVLIRFSWEPIHLRHWRHDLGLSLVIFLMRTNVWHLYEKGNKFQKKTKMSKSRPSASLSIEVAYLYVYIYK